MNTTDRSAILNMLATGKITAAEAMDLLDKKEPVAQDPPESVGATDAIKASEMAQSVYEDELSIEEIKAEKSGNTDPFKGLTITEDDVLLQKDGQRPRWLKIRVRDLGTGRNKVSVTLPLGLVSFGLGIARRFGADFDDDHNVDELWRQLKEGQRGVLVDVEDEEDNEQVQIYLD